MTGRLRTLALAACIGAVVVAVAAAWTEPDPELSRDEARRFVAEAFEHVGMRPARILEGPLGGTYHAEETGPGGVPAWRVRLELGKKKQVARLWIHRTEARAVSLDEGKKRFMTDVQVRRLNEFVLDDAADDRRQRDVAGTIGAGLIVAVAALTIRRDERAGA